MKKQELQEKYDAESALEEETYLINTTKKYSDNLIFEADKDIYAPEDVHDDIVEEPTISESTEENGTSEDLIAGKMVDEPYKELGSVVSTDTHVEYIFKNSCFETCNLDPAKVTSEKYLVIFDVEPGTKIEVKEITYAEKE